MMTSAKAVNSGQTEREAMLPCPFCGDKAEYKHNSFHGDESMAVCRCCGAQAFWSKWQDRAASTATATDGGKALSNLLAVIHRDGGHYEQQHGTEKAARDAEAVVVAMRALSEQSHAPASPSGEDAAEQSAAPMAKLIAHWDSSQPTGFRWEQGIVRGDFADGTPVYAHAAPLPRASEQADEAVTDGVAHFNWLCSLMPEGFHWGEPLTPDVLDHIAIAARAKEPK